MGVADGELVAASAARGTPGRRFLLRAADRSRASGADFAAAFAGPPARLSFAPVAGSISGGAIAGGVAAAGAVTAGAVATGVWSQATSSVCDASAIRSFAARLSCN